jgi:hypothetical protein
MSHQSAGHLVPASEYNQFVDNDNYLKSVFDALFPYLYNRSGGTLTQGAVVIFDKDYASSFTTTAIQGDRRAYGVVKDGSITNDEQGYLARAGEQTVNVTGAVKIGDALITSTTPGCAMANGGAQQPGLIGFALTSFAGPGTGQVQASIKPDFYRGNAAVGFAGSNTAEDAESVDVQCGTLDDRKVLAIVLAVGNNTINYAAPKVGGVDMSTYGAEITGWHNNGNYSYARMYYYDAPATGIVSCTGADFVFTGYGVGVTIFIALNGVKSLRTLVSSILTTETPSVNCSDAVAGDLVVGIIAIGDNASLSIDNITAIGTGQTSRERTAKNTGGYWILSDAETKDATIETEVLSWTQDDNRKCLMLAVPVEPI